MKAIRLGEANWAITTLAFSMTVSLSAQVTLIRTVPDAAATENPTLSALQEHEFRQHDGGGQSMSNTRSLWVQMSSTWQFIAIWIRW